MFAAFRRRWPWAMWLDSGDERDPQGRYDILVADPRLRVTAGDGGTWVQDRAGARTCHDEDPLAVVQRLLSAVPVEPGPAPFAGGAVGYFGYDLGRRMEGLPARTSPTPLMQVGIYDWALVLEHHRETAWVAGEGVPRDELQAVLAAPMAPQGAELLGTVSASPDAVGYRRAFERLQRYIREGDCYQVNLARRLELGYRGDPLAIYAYLRSRAAGPFSAYLDLPDVSVLSLSPERFLQVANGAVETRPIKGTRPRGADALADEAQRQALAASAKDRAENVMIVDLLRNDLGKTCRDGSIEVPQLCRVETYPNVHHLVSVVRGCLAAGHGPLDVLRGCLPGGSITGAPKHRAMEIIDELEPQARGVYCGAIGYVGFHGGMDINIAIRTATACDGTLTYWAGGGIVADSDCAAEYQETLDKASAFLGLAGRRLL